jgi:hypothetical protein
MQISPSRRHLTPNKHKKILLTIILVALALNISIFITAYPQTQKPLSSTFAADFSAYYIGEWRFFHNPTAIYLSGDYIAGDVIIEPKPQTFMYTPSFLVFFSPFMSLEYQAALNTFDLIQVLSMFALAFFIYKLAKGKDLVWGIIAALVVLVLPFSGYYWGYALGNAHVIQTTLIVAALYFGFAHKPLVSAFMLMLASFDPRVTLLAIPILLYYNRANLRKFIAGAVGFIAAFNLPFFLYNDIGFTFLQKRLKGDIIVAMYAYDWLPLIAVATITVVEALALYSVKKGFSFSKKKTAEPV